MFTSQLLSRFLGLLRQTVQAAMFGFGFHAAAYNIAITIPDMLFMLIAGGGLSSAFIPVFSELLHTDREKEAWDLFGVVVTFCSIVAITLVGIAWAFAGPIGAYMGAGKESLPLILPEIVKLSRILLPAQFAFLIGSLLIATLYARHRFLVPGFAPNIYNVGIILGALVGPAFGLGIAGMAWGALIGALIGNLLLPAVAMLKTGGRFTPSLNLKTEGVGKFFRLLGPVVLGFSLPSMAQIVSQKFASPYSVGMNTVIYYSNTLMQAPSGIFGQSLALAVFPVLTQFFAQGRMDMYRSQVTKTMSTVVYLTVPAAVFLGVMAPQIVSLLYGYGQARSAADLDAVTACLRVYSVGVVAWSIQPILMRGFFSLHKTLEPVLWSTAMTALLIAMLALQGPHGPVHLPFAAAYLCIPWSTNVAAILLVIILFIKLQGTVGNLDLKSLLITGGKACAAGAVMGLAAFGMSLLFPEHLPKWQMAIATIAVILVSSWIYIWITMQFKMPETNYVQKGVDKFKSKFGISS